MQYEQSIFHKGKSVISITQRNPDVYPLVCLNVDSHPLDSPFPLVISSSLTNFIVVFAILLLAAVINAPYFSCTITPHPFQLSLYRFLSMISSIANQVFCPIPFSTLFLMCPLTQNPTYIATQLTFYQGSFPTS